MAKVANSVRVVSAPNSDTTMSENSNSDTREVVRATAHERKALYRSVVTQSAQAAMLPAEVAKAAQKEGRTLVRNFLRDGTVLSDRNASAKAKLAAFAPDLFGADTE